MVNINLNDAIEKPLEELLNDREALALRNRTLAEAYHQRPFRHQMRKLLLNFLSTTYIPPSRTAAQTNRILLIRPDHLGDLLLTTPAIRTLRQHMPNTEIHALVGPWSAGVLANVSEVDVVLTVPFPGFTRGDKTSWSSPYQYAIQTARRLRRIGYAKAIVFRPDHWWGAWVARMTGAPVRIGYDDEDTALFLTDVVKHKHEHAVQQAMHLVEVLLNIETDPDQVQLRYPVLDVDAAYVRGYLSEWGIQDDTPIFCIHPGSGTAVKQWEPGKWAQVADILSDQLNARAVFTGGDSELAAIQSITTQMEAPPVIIAGDTDVGQLAALYARCRVVLGPDSGPLHLAVAVGTPTVTLYGPADPVEFAPWGDPKKHISLTTDIACRPCRVLDWSDDDIRYHPCVRDITVTQVLSAARLAASYQGDSES